MDVTAADEPIIDHHLLIQCQQPLLTLLAHHVKGQLTQATIGLIKHKYDPKNVKKFAAELTNNHGTTAQINKLHRTCPLTMVKYLGNKPARSHPTGMALLETFVTIVANAWIAHARNTSVLAPGPQKLSRTAE